MNGAETRSRRGQAGRAAAMNSAEQTVTWLITLGVLESPKKTISDPEGFLQASLKDGVVLCRLLERLLPGTIEKVSAPPPGPARARTPGGQARGGGRPGRREAPRGRRPRAPPGPRRGPGCAETRGRGVAGARTWWPRARAEEPTRFLCARARARGGRAGGAGEPAAGSRPGSGRHCVRARRGAGAAFEGSGPRRPGSQEPRPREEAPLRAT